jgi:hypothetical protein
VPDAGLLPTPLSIEIEVAFVVDQVSVDDCPALIDVGEAEKVAVGAGCVTVTVAVFVVVPKGPKAVSVKVVVENTKTVVDPLGRPPVSAPLSISTSSALLLVQVSVTSWPLVIDVGAAEKVAVGAGEPAPTNTVTCFEGGDALAVVKALRVYVVVAVGLTVAEPFAGFEPTPLSMLTLVTEPPPVVQESVDGDGDGTLVGLAVKEVMQPPPMSKLKENVP